MVEFAERYWREVILAVMSGLDIVCALIFLRVATKDPGLIVAIDLATRTSTLALASIFGTVVLYAIDSSAPFLGQSNMVWIGFILLVLLSLSTPFFLLAFIRRRFGDD